MAEPKKKKLQDKNNYLLMYHNKVKDGEIEVCKKIHQAIAMDEKLLNTSGVRFDIGKANRVILFIENYCKHYKGKWAGKPFKLELWQKWVISSIFGFVYDDTKENRELEQVDLRVCREVMLVVARKNGKTELAAAISLYMIVADNENSPEAYTVATKKDQAALLYKAASRMILASPVLRKLFKVQKYSAECIKNGGILEPLSNDSKTQDGTNPSIGVFDEMHEQREQNSYDVIKSGQGAREQPLLFTITTSGILRGRVYDNMYAFYSRWLTGDFDDIKHRAFIFEMDDIDEINDTTKWIKANPNLNVSVKFTYLVDQLKDALNNPAMKSGILTKNFNIPSTASEAFYSQQECQVNPFEESKIYGTYGHIGIDMANTVDTAVITYAYYDYDTKEFYTKRWIMIPEEDIIDRSARDYLNYQLYSDLGEIHLIRGNSIEESDVEDMVKKIIKDYDLGILNMAIDPWGMGSLIKKWREEFGDDFVIAARNQYRQAMSQTTHRVRLLLRANRIFFNEKMLELHLAGCAADTDKFGAVILVKLHANIRIDAVHSLNYAVKAFELYNNIYDEKGSKLSEY